MFIYIPMCVCVPVIVYVFTGVAVLWCTFVMNNVLCMCLWLLHGTLFEYSIVMLSFCYSCLHLVFTIFA